MYSNPRLILSVLFRYGGIDAFAQPSIAANACGAAEFTTLGEAMIEQTLQKYLASRPISRGEIIHAGWLVFRIANDTHPVVLESLDFKNVGSFTTDLAVADAIVEMQANQLRLHGAEEEACTLRHSAVVSKNYRPGHPYAFLKRDGRARDLDSGWYLGILDDPLDFNDPASFYTKSLYELSIADQRLLPFWLMPVQTFVSLATGEVE